MYVVDIDNGAEGQYSRLCAADAKGSELNLPAGDKTRPGV